MTTMQRLKSFQNAKSRPKIKVAKRMRKVKGYGRGEMVTTWLFWGLKGSMNIRKN